LVSFFPAAETPSCSVFYFPLRLLTWNSCREHQEFAAFADDFSPVVFFSTTVLLHSLGFLIILEGKLFSISRGRRRFFLLFIIFFAGTLIERCLILLGTLPCVQEFCGHSCLSASTPLERGLKAKNSPPLSWLVSRRLAGFGHFFVPDDVSGLKALALLMACFDPFLTSLGVKASELPTVSLTSFSGFFFFGIFFSFFPPLALGLHVFRFHTPFFYHDSI